MNFKFHAGLAVIMLSGCQIHPDDSRTPPTVSVNAAHIHTTQQQLWNDGAINQVPQRHASALTANSDRLSVDWEGDAIELLSQLARQRGLAFAYSGVRLPLPVIVHVSNITFENLLRQLETQIGWRATLKQQPLELHLYFALPDKGGRLA